MKHKLLILLLALSFFSTPASSPAAEKSYYLIGNSLTWDTVPSRLAGDVQWHVDCGKPLHYIHKHPAKPCVKTSTLWPQALKEKQYDYLSMQSHYGATLQEDVDTISKWIEMQPKAIIVIHTGWARAATRAEEYAQTKPAEKMQHSRAHIAALIARLKKSFPQREFRQTHAQELLARVAEDAAADKAPIQDVKELYRDAIHMNVMTGRYLMHNAMRHALDQPRSQDGFNKLDPKMKKYLDSVLDTLK